MCHRQKSEPGTEQRWLLSTCVSVSAHAPAPPPIPRQQGGAWAAHFLGQSPVLGPLADVAAQHSQRRLVFDRLLLHGLDLQRPALLWGRAQGRGPACGPPRVPGQGGGSQQGAHRLQALLLAPSLPLPWGPRSSLLSSGDELCSLPDLPATEAAGLLLIPSGFGVDSAHTSPSPTPASCMAGPSDAFSQLCLGGGREDHH